MGGAALSDGCREWWLYLRQYLPAPSGLWVVGVAVLGVMSLVPSCGLQEWRACAGSPGETFLTVSERAPLLSLPLPLSFPSFHRKAIIVSSVS